MRKLVIISGSKRVLKEPNEPIAALQRFDGNFTRLVRKYSKRNQNFDILILSPVYGLVRAEEKVVFKEPIAGNWEGFSLSDDDLAKQKKLNLSKLQKIIGSKEYDEVYVSAGKSMLKLIEGFEKIIPERVSLRFAEGNGIGCKMASLGEYLKATS
jgi:hypothetical protein